MTPDLLNIAMNLTCRNLIAMQHNRWQQSSNSLVAVAELNINLIYTLFYPCSACVTFELFQIRAELFHQQLKEDTNWSHVIHPLEYLLTFRSFWGGFFENIFFYFSIVFLFLLFFYQILNSLPLSVSVLLVLIHLLPII